MREGPSNQEQAPAGRVTRRGTKRDIEAAGPAEGDSAGPETSKQRQHRVTRAAAAAAAVQGNAQQVQDDGSRMAQIETHTLQEQQQEQVQQQQQELEAEACPPVLLKFPLKPSEPLNAQALAALSSQDAQSHDHHIKLLRFDDSIAEVASQRGLLVQFIIKTLRSYQPQPEMVVEAPEFMTVEYLKRRIMKAKLMKGEFLNPMKFVLRRRIGGEAGAVRGMEEILTKGPTGDELFLFNLGFEAPGSYELFIASAPTSTDKEQQDQLLATAGASEVTGRRPGEMNVDPQRAIYQALLRGGQQTRNAHQSPPLLRGAPVYPRYAPMQQHQEIAQDNSRVGEAHIGVNNAYVGGGAAAVGVEGGTADKQQKPRRQLGRWHPEEVSALIEGVQTFGTSWAQIYERYVSGGRINQSRTQVDLKDKWRNLVKLVTQPNKQARGLDMDEDTRQLILRLVFSQDVTAADYTSPDVAPGQEMIEQHQPLQQLQEAAAELAARNAGITEDNLAAVMVEQQQQQQQQQRQQ